MLLWAIIFFLIAVIAALFGFTDIAKGAMTIARIIFFIFVVVFVVFLILALAAGL